jgi:predicted ArsR family transcriptional regulator
MTANPEDIEAQIARNRAELASTIDELTDRLDPKAKAEELVEKAKQIVKDAGTDPDTRPEDRNRARIILGVGAAAAVGLLTALIRKL